MTTRSPKAAKAAATRAQNLARQHEKEQIAKEEKAIIKAALLKDLSDANICPADAVKAALLLAKMDGIC